MPSRTIALQGDAIGNVEHSAQRIAVGVERCISGVGIGVQRHVGEIDPREPRVVGLVIDVDSLAA